MLQVTGPVLVMLCLALLGAVLTLAVRRDLSAAGCTAVLAAGLAVGGVAAKVELPSRPIWPVLIAAAIVFALARVYLQRRTSLYPAGALLWVVWLAFGLTTTVWGIAFLSSLRLSGTTRVLVWCCVGLAGITLPSAVITTREGWEPLLRRHWRRPRTPLTARPARQPRISIHVPCHAEPPDVVISTLNRIAELDYDNAEVLVIDNNTSDPSLWVPVREHCAVLGPRFRFFHVEGLTGAKAGALNWALQRTDPTAELIAVVDADYQVEPDWLSATVGYFADPSIGFVQCPHAYRDYDRSLFGRMAATEYSVFFNAGMVSLNEHDAGLTVGTMSLIRRQALLEAGGWAEWCLTEDSELAIRIHAAGYSSVYLSQPYGRGLIPETFAAYRTQRFRWTFGPVQEFRRHWRLFLPSWLGGRSSRLTRSQKLHHANHGIDVIGVGLRALAVPLAGVTAVSMLVHHEHVAVPFELWLASTVTLVSSLLIRGLVYSRAVGATLAQAVGGTLAFASLSFVIARASLSACLHSTSPWRRTSKFPARARGLGALVHVQPETIGGGACALAGTALFVLGPVGGITTMIAIALYLRAAMCLGAPLLTVFADAALPRGGRHAAARVQLERAAESRAA